MSIDVVEVVIRRQRSVTLFPYTTLFRSRDRARSGIRTRRRFPRRSGRWGSSATIWASSATTARRSAPRSRSEEHTSELQSQSNLVCRLLLEKKIITFLVSMQISISSLQTYNVNRCGRSRHTATTLSHTLSLHDALPISGPGQIRNSNTSSISAQVRSLGLECHDLGVVRDDREAIRAAIQIGRAHV